MAGSHPRKDLPLNDRPMSRERVSRGATFALLAQLVGGVLTAILTIFLGRDLSAGQLGAFTFGLSVITLATLFADLGISSSTARFLAERRDQPGAAAAVFRTAVRLKLFTGIPVTVILLILAGPICAAFGIADAVWVMRGCAIAMLTQTLFDLYLSTFVALGKIRYNLILTTIESVAEVGATVSLVLLGAAATGAAFGRAIGFAVGLMAGLAVFRRTLGRLSARHRADDLSLVSPRQIVGYAGPLVLVDAAFRVFTSIDVLLIAALVGGGAPVAAFALPVRLTIFLEYPGAAVSSAVAPRMTRRANREDLTLLAQSMRYLVIVQMLITVPLLIWPEAIIYLLFGSKYPEASAVLRGLAPYVFLSGIAQLTTVSVNFLGEAWRRVPLAVIMLTVNVIIDVLLLPRIGILAGAIGTSAAYAIWVPAHVWILRRRGTLRVGPLLVTTARSCLAGGAMVGALALLGTGRVPLLVMLLGGLVGPLVYIAVLFVFRELGRGDIAVLRRLLARRVFVQV
jgi:O-antigen/teichoic acid export membrane protein